MTALETEPETEFKYCCVGDDGVVVFELDVGFELPPPHAVKNIAIKSAMLE